MMFVVMTNDRIGEGAGPHDRRTAEDFCRSALIWLLEGEGSDEPKQEVTVNEQEQSSTGEDWASAATRRRTRRSELVTALSVSHRSRDLTPLASQLSVIARSPALDLARQTQRLQGLWRSPAFANPISSPMAGIAKAVLPTFELSRIRFSALETFKTYPILSRPGFSETLRSQSLVWKGAPFVAIRDLVGPPQHLDQLQVVVGGLLRRWSALADVDTELAGALARAALAAAFRAREAVLHGRVDDLDHFITNWLDQQPTSWRRDAVAMVLLDGEWIPDESASVGSRVLKHIKQLTTREARNHKFLAETQLGGRRVIMLDQPVKLESGQLGVLADKLVDPSTRDGAPIDLEWDNRIDRLLRRLRPDEQHVVLALGDGAGDTWTAAAVAVGLPAEYGERVRRKCKRVRNEIELRAAGRDERTADRGLSSRDGR
jgi:hypothetical protein